MYDNKSTGEMAERFNVPPWKGGVCESVPGVRISLSPQVYVIIPKYDNSR